jgi:capsular exopolysaccharide synthesis family protein
MHNHNSISGIIYPLKKRWYIVLLCVLVACVVANQYLLRATPEYQATAAIMIAENKAGVSGNNLYQNYDAFNVNAKAQTEVEVLKSRTLFEKALRSTDFFVEYYRVDDIKTEEVYGNNPFHVDYRITDSLFSQQRFDFKYNGGDNFVLSYEVGGYKKSVNGVFGKTISERGISFTINKDQNVTADQQEKLLNEPWYFVVYSEAELTARLMNKGYIVKQADKDVNIIRLYYTHTNAEKAAKLINAIANTYIKLGAEEKQEFAGNTIDFIGQQLTQVGKELAQARDAIKTFRVSNDIVNIPQETEATFKTLGALEIQKVELNMQLSTLENLSDYMRRNREVPLSPDYSTIIDPIFSENLQRMNGLIRDRNELLRVYTEEDDKVKNANAEISRLRASLLDGVDNTRRKMFIRQDELMAKINEQRATFNDVPEKESTLAELNRNYALHEKVYNFLIEKQAEAMITRQVNMTFNKVIEPAIVPTQAELPGKEAVWALAIFVGALSGIFLAYLRHYMSPVLETPSDLSPNSSIPVAGQIRKMKKDENAYNEFTTLAMRLMMNHNTDEHMVITVTSTKRGEGKTYIATHLAKTLASMDKRVVLIDMNTHAPKLGEIFNIRELTGISDVYNHQSRLQDVIRITSMPNLDIITAGQDDEQIGHLLATTRTRDMIAELKQQYDAVIIDTPDVGEYIDAIPFMKWSNLNLYVVSADNERTQLVANAELVKEEYRLQEVQYVVNKMKHKRNHTGYLPVNSGVVSKKLTTKTPQFLNMFTW